MEPESSFLKAKCDQEQKTQRYLLFLRKSLSQGLLNAGRISRDILLFFCSLPDTWPWLLSGTVPPLCLGVLGMSCSQRASEHGFRVRHSEHHAQHEQGSQEEHCLHGICAHRVKGSGGCWASLARGFLLICGWCVNGASSDKASENPRKKNPAHVQDALGALCMCMHPENFPAILFVGLCP